jgi:hypothetical protein
MTESRAGTTRGEELTDTDGVESGANAETPPARRVKAANPMTFKERTMMK